jgi:two-component sensor histidine kinase
MAERNARNLLGLVNQLLDLSKLEAGKLTLQASKGNIISFAKGITMSFESLAERKGIQLKFISEKDEIELYFDRDKMAKILTNLLSNAFKFTPEGGEITVALSLIPSPLGRGMSEGQGEGKVQITVADTGIGISEEELPKLFDRFYQVDSSQTREHEGTGIGLALTKELVDLHKGKIRVKSKVGQGSEFIIELLLGKEHLSADEIVELANLQTDVILSPEGTKNLNDFVVDDKSHFDKLSVTSEKKLESEADKTIILVVEDNADVRSYIKDSLGNNFQIEEAANGELGVEKAKEDNSRFNHQRYNDAKNGWE